MPEICVFVARKATPGRAAGGAAVLAPGPNWHEPKAVHPMAKALSRPRHKASAGGSVDRSPAAVFGIPLRGAKWTCPDGAPRTGVDPKEMLERKNSDRFEGLPRHRQMGISAEGRTLGDLPPAEQSFEAVSVRADRP